MSRTNSPRPNANMLLAPACNLHLHPHLHNHHHQTAIKLPPRHGSPQLESRGLSQGVTMPSSSASTSIIVDRQGQAHDPGYLDALRELHNKIGQEATQASTYSSRRRRPSSASGSQHTPSRPSALGLGLTSHMAAVDLNTTDDSSDDDDDDDYSNRYSDSYAALFEEAKRHDDAQNRQRSNGISPSHTPSFPANAYVQQQQQRQQQHTLHPHTSSSGWTPRHASFSTNAALEEEMMGNAARSRRSSWSARRMSSPQRRTTGTPPHSAGHGAAFTTGAFGSGANSSSVQRKDDGWGFTGIVDVERERSNNLARAAMTQPGTPRHTARLLEEATWAASAPDSPRLVAAASLHRSKASPPLNADMLGSSNGSGSGNGSAIGKKARQSSFGHSARSGSTNLNNKPILKKTSVSEFSTISPSNSSVHSASLDLSGAVATAVNRRKSSFASSSNHASASLTVPTALSTKSPSLRQKLVGATTPRKQRSRSRPSSSNGATGETERTREYHAGDGEHTTTGLRTIQSGRPMSSTTLLDDLHQLAQQQQQQQQQHSPFSTFVGSATASPHHAAPNTTTTYSSSIAGASESSPNPRRSLGSVTREQLEAAWQQRQDEADFHTAGPSRMKEGVEAIKRHGSDAADVGVHSYELRRKVELITMGIRFNAFKARQKLKRGFKHHEA